MNVDVPPGPQTRFIVTGMGGGLIVAGTRLRSYDGDTMHIGIVQPDGSFIWEDDE